MKIKPNHFNTLKAYIADSVEKHGTAKFVNHFEELRNDERVKDISTRFAWDLLWTIPNKDRIPLMDEVYQYLNDNHVDTALKKIARELFPRIEG